MSEKKTKYAKKDAWISQVLRNNNNIVIITIIFSEQKLEVKCFVWTLNESAYNKSLLEIVNSELSKIVCLIPLKYSSI